MSIWVPSKRRFSVKPSKFGSEHRGLQLLFAAPSVLDHQVDHLDQMFADLAHSAALDAGMGTLQQHGEKVGGQNRVLETGGLAKSYDPLVRADLVLLNDAPRRMLGVRKLRHGIAQCRSAVLHFAQLGRGTPTPVLNQPRRTTAVFGGQVLPLLLLVGD